MARTNPILIGIVIASVLLAGVGLVVADTNPATENKTDTPTAGNPATVSVSASGSAAGEPDQVVIRLAATATAEDASTARSDVASNISAIRSNLIDLGLNESQIRTSDYDLYAERERGKTDESADSVTYRARHTLEITVNDIERAGEVIDTAIDAGANRVYDVRFTLSDSTRDELRQQALTNAMSNAETEAQTIAESGNLSITGIHSVSTNQVRIPSMRVEYAAAGGADAGTDISTGPVTVSASVQVQYNATNLG